MRIWLKIILGTLRSSVRSRRELALENLALRQQLATLKFRSPRPHLSDSPPVLGRIESTLARLDESFAHSAAGYSDPLASSGFSLLLALEEPKTRPSKDRWRNQAIDPKNVPGKPTLGRTTNTRRASEAGHRSF